MTRIISYVLGVIMTLAGLLAFAMAGTVLGILAAGALLASVWVIAGVVTLAVAVWMPGNAMLWAKVAGVVLAVIAILGYVMPGPVLGLLDNTPANNALHLALAVVFLVIGFLPLGRTMAPSMGSMSPPEAV